VVRDISMFWAESKLLQSLGLRMHQNWPSQFLGFIFAGVNRPPGPDSPQILPCLRISLPKQLRTHDQIRFFISDVRSRETELKRNSWNTIGSHRHWRRQLWDTGARAPSTFNCLIFLVTSELQKLWHRTL